jgi:hypothetical protein
MKGPFDTLVYLKEHQSLRLPDGAGLEVRCLLGNLWITEEGNGEDNIIADGESFVLDRSGLSLATALRGPALLVVHPGSGIAQHPLQAAA